MSDDAAKALGGLFAILFWAAIFVLCLASGC